MAKIWVQKFPTVWQTSSSFAASGSDTSGSILSMGYARVVGMLVSSASAKAASGLRVWQSVNTGSTWDYWTDYAPSASSGSAFSIEVVGDAVKVDFRNGNDAASIFITGWWLRPV